MNKKTLDNLLQYQNYNQTLFQQSIGIVQCTKNIIPASKIPLQMLPQKTSLQIKKKQQMIQTNLSKSIKLFGQILGVSKNSFGTITDYAVDVFEQLTDLIETSCQSYKDKKKSNLKAIQKQKQQSQINNSISQGKNLASSRPQDNYPSIKPSLFDRHSQELPHVDRIKLQCDKVQNSFSITQPFIYVSSKQSLQKMIMQLKQCKQIAVDVEHSNKSYQGFTCLIQISSRYKDYIIDVFPLWQDIPLLKQLIQNQNIIKVMHGAEMDAKWLQRDFNIHIRNLFDTYKASRVLGYPKFSYAYLLHHYCNTTTDKTYQLADWRQRPLTAQMLQYARIDTHYLLQIWDKLLQDLTKQSQSMNLDPIITIKEIYRSSYDVTLSQIQMFSYKKKDLYQNIKNDTKLQDFEIIEKVFWTIDKLAREQNEAFDDLINKRTLTDIIGRVKDLIQNKRATIDMLRVKIDRLIGVVKAHKHQKVALLLAPLKKQLEKHFLEPKKEQQLLGKKKIKTDSQASLIQKIQQQKKLFSQKQKQNVNILVSSSTQSQVFNLQKPLIAIEQLDYPLKTYQNFSLQQRLNNKKSTFSSLINFEPIMTFLSKRMHIEQKKQDSEQNKSQGQNLVNDQMDLQNQSQAHQQNQANTQQAQNEGFLQFKRIKPNVMYVLEQQNAQQKSKLDQQKQKKPKKKRKQQQYEQKIRNKEGNIYDLLIGDDDELEDGEMKQ